LGYTNNPTFCSASSFLLKMLVNLGGLYVYPRSPTPKDTWYLIELKV